MKNKNLIIKALFGAMFIGNMFGSTTDCSLQISNDGVSENQLDENKPECEIYFECENNNLQDSWNKYQEETIKHQQESQISSMIAKSQIFYTQLIKTFSNTKIMCFSLENLYSKKYTITTFRLASTRKSKKVELTYKKKINQYGRYGEKTSVVYTHYPTIFLKEYLNITDSQSFWNVMNSITQIINEKITRLTYKTSNYYCNKIDLKIDSNNYVDIHFAIEGENDILGYMINLEYYQPL